MTTSGSGYTHDHLGFRGHTLSLVGQDIQDHLRVRTYKITCGSGHTRSLVGQDIHDHLRVRTYKII